MDSYTYPNFIGLANRFGIQLIAIDSDACGMRADHLASCCKTLHIKGIYLIPSCNNPTAVLLSPERRGELAEVINRHHLILIEDDAYALLAPEYTPVSCLVPERYVYLSPTSKALCAGLQITYLTFAPDFYELISSGTQFTSRPVPLLHLEILTNIIEHDISSKLIEKRRTIAAKRNRLYRKYFPVPASCNPFSFFQWLQLPAGCGGYNFELQAKKAGILLYGSDRFLVGAPKQTAFVRVSLCAAKSSEELERGLRILKDLIGENTFSEVPGAYIW